MTACLARPLSMLKANAMSTMKETTITALTTRAHRTPTVFHAQSPPLATRTETRATMLRADLHPLAAWTEPGAVLRASVRQPTAFTLLPMLGAAGSLPTALT